MKHPIQAALLLLAVCACAALEPQPRRVLPLDGNEWTAAERGAYCACWCHPKLGHEQEPVSDECHPLPCDDED